MIPALHLAPLAVSCGEPAGIGPELIVQARAIARDVPFFWIGDPRHLPPETLWQEIAHGPQAHEVPASHLPVMRLDFAGKATPGQPDPRNAAGVIAAIKRGVELALAGEASSLCTVPINKKALKDGANFPYPGHTEYLAALGGGAEVVMCLASSLLRVVPATIHIPLSQVPQTLTPALLEQVIRTTHAGMRRDFSIAHPRIAIAGLNPHAGEGGAMGTEEQAWMIPLLAKLRLEGFKLIGPLPADTMFHARARAGYDVAICAYHDQALIPIKTLAFDEGVNVTLGLPFIRTSPDHGTAFDIAGKGLARPDSLVAALRMAWDMAGLRAKARDVVNE